MINLLFIIGIIAFIFLLSKEAGIVFIIVFASYIIYMIAKAKEENDRTPNDQSNAESLLLRIGFVPRTNIGVRNGLSTIYFDVGS